MLRRIMAGVFFAAAGASAAASNGIPLAGDALQGEALLKALRGGGYTLFIRHTERDRTRSLPPDRAECLVEGGKAQARAIGEAMKALQVPIGESIASPMCRTMETAELIAGRAVANEDVRKDTPENGVYFAKLIRMLSAKPEPGTNRLVSGHVSAFDVLQGPPGLVEGETAIFRSEGTRRVLVARLRTEDWKALASPANRGPRKERSSAPDPQLRLADGALLDALRAGGYTVYFRHSLTDMSQKDRPTFVATDCASQRNLKPEGREQASRIGEAFKALKLPVTEVIASPYCRTMQTARLMTGQARAEEAVRGRAPTVGGAADYSRLEQMLATPVTRGLRVIVGHGNGLVDIAGPPHLEEGESVVMRAVEGGGWIVVAHMRPDDWTALVKLAGPQ